MFFDRLAGIIERHLPDLVPQMQDAKLFRLETTVRSSGEVIDEWHPDERVIENFHLPFKTVAIEYASERWEAADACVVLTTTGRPEDRRFRFISGQGFGETLIGVGTLTAFPDAQGLASYGRMMTLNSMRLYDGSKKAGLLPVECCLSWLDEHYDKIVCLERGTPFQQLMARHHKENLSAEELARASKALIDATEDVKKLQTNLAFSRCILAVLGVVIINEPAKFIVEERPLGEPRSPPTEIPRSVGRPHYIVLKPQQIRQRFLYPDGQPDDDEEETGEHRKVTPHERRGHYRRLQSDRFKNARGQVIWIKPMWIGPSEAVKGKNRYRVMLEL